MYLQSFKLVLASVELGNWSDKERRKLKKKKEKEENQKKFQYKE